MITKKVGRTLKSWLFVSIVALVLSFIYRILALISLKNETHNSQIEIIEETQADISAVTASTAVWNFGLLLGIHSEVPRKFHWKHNCSWIPSLKEVQNSRRICLCIRNKWCFRLKVNQKQLFRGFWSKCSSKHWILLKVVISFEYFNGSTIQISLFKENLCLKTLILFAKQFC